MNFLFTFNYLQSFVVFRRDVYRGFIGISTLNYFIIIIILSQIFYQNLNSPARLLNYFAIQLTSFIQHVVQTRLSQVLRHSEETFSS